MASSAHPFPVETPQPNEPFVISIAKGTTLEKAETKAKKKRRQREKYKLAKRNKAGVAGKESYQVQMKVNRAANLRRQRLQKVLDTEGKMGLTKLGCEQLTELCSKRASIERPAMGDLDPSAQKVLGSILAQEYDELMAWMDERQPGQVPKEKREEDGKETKLGEEEKEWEGQEEMDMEDMGDIMEEEEEEEEEERDNDEGANEAPEPVTP